jgi:hypothetical protein
MPTLVVSHALRGSSIHLHKYLAGRATDVRITVFLLANRDSKSDSGVHVIVNAIDTDMAKQGA